MNPTFPLGGELEVRRLGVGAMRIVADPDEGKRVLRRALELGVDVADGLAFFPWAPLGESLGRPEDELRWLLDRSPAILPIPGTSKAAHLEQNMRAVA